MKEVLMLEYNDVVRTSFQAWLLNVAMRMNCFGYQAFMNITILSENVWN